VANSIRNPEKNTPMEFPLVQNRKHVFIVDDDQAVRDSLKFALQLEGLAVDAVACGADLLRNLDLKADCLVLDCQMPEMDGFAVMAALAERRINIPTIMITAPLTGALRRQAEKAGAFSILEKPLSNGVLLQNILHAVA
jgi:two-component system, LuxR family, response regulator FixJ